MITIKMLHSYKAFAAGATVQVETNLAEWLISRNYAVSAVPVPVSADIVEPARSVRASGRSKK